MLVLHANWADNSLHLWAESVEGYCAEKMATDASVKNRANYAGIQSTPVQDQSGTIAVAGESAISAHPFAATSEGLSHSLMETGQFDPESLREMGTIELELPGDRHDPWPSDRLAGFVGVDEPPDDPCLSPWRVETLRLSPGRTLEMLLGMENLLSDRRMLHGHAVRFWIVVARFVVDLLEDQRFIPSMNQYRGKDVRGSWQPWLHDEEAHRRVRALLAAMPPVVRAVRNGNDHAPWPILEEALSTLTNISVREALRAEDYIDSIEDRDPSTDALVSWLAGLLDVNDRIVPPSEVAQTMIHDVKRWIGALDERGQDLPLHLCFKLSEPVESLSLGELEPIPDDMVWRLSFHLQSQDDAGVFIDAEQVWNKQGGFTPQGMSAHKPQDILLTELGRASRMYAKIESVLAEASPTGMSLTTRDAYEFLIDMKPILEESGFGVIAPAWWGDPSAQIGARLFIDTPELEDVRRPGSGSDGEGQSLLGLESLVHYEWKIAVGDQPLSMEEFQALAQQRTPLVRLRGQWVEINPQQLSSAARFLDSQPGGEMSLLKAIRMAYGGGEEKIGIRISGLDATGWVADLLGASSNEQRMPMLKQPENFLGTLRPYQRSGLSWMSFLDQFGLGACLADDMGLGKTIQMIALLLHERLNVNSDQWPGPTLLIVPTSLVGNWVRELNRFGPSLTIHVSHGPDRPVGEEFYAIIRGKDIVITTYGLVSRDQETLCGMPWHRVVLDEAQYIKNPPTKQTKVIRMLKAQRRAALTGTPVENRLAELWSIMEFLNPGYLGTAGEFRKKFAIPIERHSDQTQAERLRGLIQPFILRRLKTDPKVISDLPACVETKEYSTLTSEQATLYEQAVQVMLSQIDRSEGIKRRGAVLATLVKLKQICDHPGLVLKEIDAIVKNAQKANAAQTADTQDLVRRSGKCKRLKVMLEEVLAVGERALIFTQYRRMGHILQTLIRGELDCEALFLHGGTPIAKRQEMIDRFNDPNGGVPVFVLSLKAGGVGLNLTAANHVFHYDRWWNPAVENQATDRAFRIGQSRTVHVHKFVCVGTLEEHIDQMIEQKTQLAENVIGSGENWLTELGTSQLRDILTLRQSAREIDT